jgi:hypothetical protein
LGTECAAKIPFACKFRQFWVEFAHIFPFDWEQGNRWMEARGGIEPPIKVLQTFALPLGDRAGP